MRSAPHTVSGPDRHSDRRDGPEPVFSQLPPFNRTRVKNLTGKMTEEECELSAVFDWAEWALKQMPEVGLLVHIPNGGKTNQIIGNRFKMMGVRKGFPDLMLSVPRGKYHGLFIEMKSKTGYARPEQKAWLAVLNHCGYLAVVCKGANAAIEEILNYLTKAEAA